MQLLRLKASSLLERVRTAFFSSLKLNHSFHLAKVLLFHCGAAFTSCSLWWSVPGSLYTVFQISAFGVLMTQIPQRDQHQNPLPSDKSSEHSRLTIRAQRDFVGLAVIIICLFLSWLYFSQRKIPPKVKLLWFGIVWSLFLKTLTTATGVTSQRRDVF